MLETELPPRDGAASDLLVADLIERVLASVDNPGRTAAFIAEELRALIGARTVALLVRVNRPDGYALRSVFPERRRGLAESAGARRLASLAQDYRAPRLVMASESGPEADALAELGIGSALVLPLAYGSFTMGALLLLDLLELSTSGQALAALNRLSSVLSLVLRNAELYSHLEDVVAERTAQLEKRRRELEILLKEVHHRVKNNLQIVLSLLYLKASTAESEAARAVLEESQARIYAMSLVHETIYRSGDFSGIDLAEYAPRIADYILDAARPAAARDYRIDSLRLELDQAIPCGLIVAELVGNAAKHGLGASGGTGRLRLSGGSRDGEVWLEVADDGPGLPPEARAALAGPAVDEEAPGAGVGLTIVGNLAAQLHGRLAVGDGPGTAISLFFRLD
jgi:two-component sensor histidine kinase